LKARIKSGVVVQIADLPPRQLHTRDHDRVVVVGRCAAAARATFVLSCDTSRRSRFVSLCQLLDRLHRLIVGHVEGFQIDDSVVRWRCAHATAPAPVSASIRRTPAATPPSATMTKADVPGRADVRAAAQLQAESRHADDADLVAVLFAKQRHRACRNRLLRRPHLRRHRRVAADLLVDDALETIDLVARHLLNVLEVDRRRSGATSDPACLTCVPSTSRSAACRRCVAVCCVASRCERRRRLRQ